jgi:hypothetical protein
LENVFLPQLALVADQRELQSLISPLEFVNSRAVTALRIDSADSLESGLITLNSPSSPRFPFSAMSEIDIERAVGLDRPNRPKRIGPGADQSRLSTLLEHGASGHQLEPNHSQTNFENDLSLHAVMLQSVVCSRKKNRVIFTEGNGGLSFKQ